MARTRVVEKPSLQSWEDVNDAEIYLGIFDGPEADALQNAAVFGRTDPYNIQLIAI